MTLDEIYKIFGTLTRLDAGTCKKIRDLEVETELKLVLPRERIVSWFKTALARGKTVWLISDNYMQTPDYERFLKKCGVEGYEKLLISCETGMRKDNAAIWAYLARKGLNSPYKLTHLGENEAGDIQLPGDMGFGEYHLMSPINLLSQVPFGRSLLEQLDYRMSLYAGILFGMVLAKKFHDPFKICAEFTTEGGRLILKNFREAGYWLYGVPLLTFILQLVQKSIGMEKVLFLAQGGYFLQRLYQFSAKLLNIEALPSNYFYKSQPEIEENPDKVVVIDTSVMIQFETIFSEPGKNHFEEISEIHDGIKDFCRDVLEIFGDIILRVPIDENFVACWIRAFADDDKIISPELQAILKKT